MRILGAILLESLFERSFIMEIFRNLRVWQESHKLVLDVYNITKTFPAEEKFGLVSQMRRAAVSVPANTAEGTKRRTDKDKRHYYCMAQSSLEELKYYFILSYDLNHLNKDKGKELMEKSRHISAMFTRLIDSLK